MVQVMTAGAAGGVGLPCYLWPAGAGGNGAAPGRGCVGAAAAYGKLGGSGSSVLMVVASSMLLLLVATNFLNCMVLMVPFVAWFATKCFWDLQDGPPFAAASFMRRQFLVAYNSLNCMMSWMLPCHFFLAVVLFCGSALAIGVGCLLTGICDQSFT
jgi:hypothetical protein